LINNGELIYIRHILIYKTQLFTSRHILIFSYILEFEN